MNQLRGSGAIKQLADIVIAIEGNQQGKDPNLRMLRLLKGRLFGKLGIADTLAYSETTGRLLTTKETYKPEDEKEF
jgi:twinkle protein